MNDQGSGLELDLTNRRPSAPRQTAPVETVPRPLPPRLSTRAPDVVEDEGTDSATAGAFIVITMVHLLLGLALAMLGAQRGEATIVLLAVLVSAVITYVGYYITGRLVALMGIVALVLFGGWFSLLVGFVAQLVHQLCPWLSWKVLGVATAVAVVLTLIKDLAVH